MKQLTKLAIGLGLASFCAGAIAGQVELRFQDVGGQTPAPVIYNFTNLNVNDQGEIIIQDANYISGYLPGSDGSVACGANTTLDVDSGSCLPNLALLCDSATTTVQDGRCVGTGSVGSSSSNPGSGSSSSSSTSSSSSSSVGGGSNNCPERPNNVLLATNPVYNWPVATPGWTLYLSQRNIHSYEITTTANPQYEGQLSLAFLVNTSKVRKDIWISECPGGDAIAPVCKKTSALTTSLYWAQNGNTAWRCPLETSKTYYINVQNVDNSCSVTAGCNALLQHITNNLPN